MTADLIPFRGDASVVVSQAEIADRAVGRLAEWAESAQAAHAVAEQLSRSSFVPDQFRGKPVELTAAILAGSEAGLSPMAAMRSFDIINGQAAPRAITLRAIVQSQGHEIILVESTDSVCKMKGRRRGSSEWQEVRWTMDRARQLGLANKNNWKSQPAAMLVARATSEICRLVASDAILGIAYTVEEIDDGGPSVAAEASGGAGVVSESGTRRMSRQRSRQAVTQPAPEVVDEVADPEDAIADEAVEVVESIDPVEAWASIAGLLGAELPTTLKPLQVWVRQLFRHMETVGVWQPVRGVDALHVALARRSVDHLTDLRSAELQSFAADARAAALEVWERHQEPAEEPDDE